MELKDCSFLLSEDKYFFEKKMDNLEGSKAEAFLTRNEVPVVLFCDNYGSSKENEFSASCDVINIIAYSLLNKGKMSGYNYAGKVVGVGYPPLNTAELQVIRVESAKFGRLGIGSNMLKMFENSVLNKGIHHIAGIFAPFDHSVAGYKDVKDFYYHNGYGIVSHNGCNLIYKNFNNNGQAKSIVEKNYKETNDFLYTASAVICLNDDENCIF